MGTSVLWPRRQSFSHLTAKRQRRGRHRNQPLTWPLSCTPPLAPRPLHAVDTYGGPLLGIPPWYAGAGKTTSGEEETSCDSTRNNTSFTVALTCTPGPWSVCVLKRDGEVLLHRNMKAAPEPFLKAMVPYRDDLVVCVECMFTWYWLADLCVQEGIPFVLGHALYMKTIHGGKAKNDKIDSQKIAALLRGGMLPQAYAYPAEMRATRDLLRRRIHLMRKRAAL